MRSERLRHHVLGRPGAGEQDPDAGLMGDGCAIAPMETFVDGGWLVLRRRGMGRGAAVPAVPSYRGALSPAARVAVGVGFRIDDGPMLVAPAEEICPVSSSGSCEFCGRERPMLGLVLFHVVWQ